MPLKSMHIRQMIALDYILFPLTFHEILYSLEKMGFDISASIPSPIPYGRFSGSGQIARKGKTVCVLNSSDKSIQMVGESIEQTGDELSEFLATILDSYNIDLYEKVKWFEFQSHHEYKTNSNPTELINAKFSSPMDEKLSEIFGINLKPIYARLGLKSDYPNQVEWFDIRFSPDFSRNDGYVIETIFRTENKNKYQKFVASIKPNIEKAIQSIEE